MTKYFRKIATAWLLLLAQYSSAQLFNPSLELTCVYTHTSNDASIQDGRFDLKNRHVNIGGAAFNECKLNEHLGIMLGVRYLSYKFALEGLNQLSTVHDKPAPFLWVRKYGSLSIPLLATVHLYSPKGRKTTFTFGGSWGIYFGNYARTELRSADFRNIAYSTDTIEASMTGTTDLKKPQQIFSLEGSATIQPIRKIPQLQLGVFLNVQLTKVTFEHFSALQENKTQHLSYHYEADYAQRHVNTGLKLVYDFIPGKKHQNSHNQDCVKF